jgi:hypothetical protein
MEIIPDLLAELDTRLQQIEIAAENILSMASQSYKATEAVMATLKTLIRKYKFKDRQEEIRFFKEIKPLFYAKLIYFVQVFHFETNKPAGQVQEVRKYLKHKLAAITQCSHENREFYKYVRAGATYMDHKYFVRDQFDIALSFDTSYFDCDPVFTTSHDYKMSQLLAYEMLAVFYEDQLAKLDVKTSETSWLDELGLGWSDTNVSLIELLYGLVSSGVFYHKKTNKAANVKQVFTFFEKLLGIDLGNYYRTLQEIRIRKNRTAFYDRATSNLIKRMDDSDEFPR